MSITPDVAHRLAYVRLLLSRAEEESKRPAPFSFDSISRAHDAAESFLALAAQFKGVALQKEFLKYWDAFEPVLGRPLGYKAAMQRMNQARIALKHYGNEPSNVEVERSVVAVQELITEECPQIFGVELADVALADFVQFAPARLLLVSAQNSWGEGEVDEAFADLLDCFDAIIADYEGRKLVGYRTSVFDSALDLSNLTGFHQRLDRGAAKDFADKVIESLVNLDFTVMLIGLGVDFRRYGKFKALMPMVSRNLDGIRHVAARSINGGREQEDFDFCRDFIIDTALRLSDFDFDLEDPRMAARRRPTVDAAVAED